MKLIADLHLHSKYSRAVSPKMVIPEIARWAKLKGLDLVGAPDWTHPVGVRELKAQLIETAPGIFQEKTREVEESRRFVGRKTSGVNGGEKIEPRFLLVTELSSIYSQGGRVYKIHNLVLAPSFETVEKINAELTRRGANLISDGRPIIGKISARDLVELILSQDEDCVIIPAHIWTPWFSLFGSRSGFDSIEECFGNMAKHIYAIETGMSSDPVMNWRIKELDSRQIVSFSDAHSAPNIGREATVFEIPEGKVNYQAVRQAIMGESWIKAPTPTTHPRPKTHNSSPPRISYTIEFYPQEGRYHYTGHRKCGVRHSPKETKKLGETCPVCGKPLTVGVMHRVEELAAREIKDEKLKMKNDEFGVKKIGYKNRPPYVMLVPLAEIIAEVKGVGKLSKSVVGEYLRLVSLFGSEFKILLTTLVEEIAKVGGEKLADGILRVRSGQVSIEPGFDGVYGKVKVWSFDKAQDKPKKEQMSLF